MPAAPEAWTPPEVTASSGQFDTPLSPKQETDFAQWKQTYAPKDSGEDYDLRGAFKAGLTPDPVSGHWPDTYKKPNHPTFSDQSIYAKDAPDKAGHWEGENYVPPSWTPPEVAGSSAPSPAANATFERRMDALYSGGLDNVHKLLSDRQQADLSDLLRRSANPGEMKAQMVNRAYIAHNYPDMAPMMDDNWEPIKKTFAKTVLGVDKPEVSDTELFAGIKGIYHQRKVLQDTAADMSSKIVEAAYQGNEDYRTLVPKVANPQQQAQLDEYAARVNSTVKDQAHLLSPHVVKVAGLMEQFRSGGDQSLIPQMVDEIEHLDPQTRETVVSMAALKVYHEMGEADNTVLGSEILGAIGQRMARGVATMVQGARTLSTSLDIPQVKGQAPNPYALDKNREDVRTQLLHAYNAIADPVEGKNLASKVALGLASFAPQMAAIAAAPYVGLPLVFAESQNERASALMGEGVSRPEAFAMATPQAMVDALSQMVSTNIVFKGALAPLEQTAARSGKEVLGRMAKIAGAETVTLSGITAVQQFMPAAMQDWGHRLDQSIPEVQWSDSLDGKTKGMLHNLKDSLPETTLSVAALMILGTGRAGLSEYSKFQDSLGHVDVLKAAGYTEEQANKVADQATPQGRLAVLQSMKPEGLNAKSQTDAIAKLDAENAAAKKNRVASVSKADDGQGFTVTDADGKSLGSAPTEDAANQIKADYDQSQTAVSRGMKVLAQSIGGEEAKTETGETAKSAESAAGPADLKHVVGSAQDTWADKTLAAHDEEATNSFPPEVLSALAVKGAGLIDSGVTDFNQWSKEMTDTHGAAIEPHLRQIYDEAGQLHQAQPERGAALAAKTVLEKTGAAEAPASGAQARANDNGTWTVVDSKGKEIGTVDSPEQAVDLVHETNRADSAKMSDRINDMIDYFKDRGSRGKIQVTGEKKTVQDRVKEGKMTGEQAKDLVKLYADLGILEPGTTPEQARIYGENARIYNAKTRLYDYVTRLHEGADPLVLIEEKTEEYFKQQLDSGAFTVADAEKWRSELEGKPVTPNPNEAMREREATEWFSKHAQAYVTGKAEGGNSPLPLSVRRWLDRVKEMFAGTFKLARDLMEKEANGELPEDFQKHLARSVGLDEEFLAKRAEAEERAGANEGPRNSYKATEALQAIKLPTPNREAAGLTGELQNLWQGLKFNERMKLFSASDTSLDSVAERLREDFGFSWVKGPDDVIKLAEDAFLHGKDAVSDTSMALRKPKGDKTTDMFDSGLAGEDFALAGEKAEDHTGVVDAEEAKRQAKAKADAAQGEMSFALRKDQEADRAEYGRLQAEMKAMGYDKVGTPEFNALWQKSEDIKNRNGGMPPGKTSGATYALRQAPFYSRLTRTVEDSKQEKASGEQWKAMIRNSKLGVSKGEYDLVSVDDLENGKTYTKQEVLDYLKANEVKVAPVVLGEGHEGEIMEAGKRLEDAGYTVDFDMDGEEAMILKDDEPVELDELPPELQKDAQTWIKRPQNTHFQDYTLPGAEEGSYREALLTVPEGTRALKVEKDSPTAFEVWRKEQMPLYEEGLRNNVEHLAEPNEELWNQLPQSYQRKYSNRAAEIGRSENADRDWEDGHGPYSEIKNPVVRLRYNERTTADGKKMLFLEEVQPPQKGNFEKMPELFQKNWRELGFKWALRKAVEGGFDSLGWTSGDQQAERYDLSKQVRHIDYKDMGDGTKFVGVTLQNNQGGFAMNVKDGKVESSRIGADEFVGKDLDEVIGKDATKQILEGTEGRLDATDLKVGGEGLRKLYDSDFRNVVNGLPAVKKSGQKVGTANLEVEAINPNSTFRYGVVAPEHSYSGKWDVVRRDHGHATATYSDEASAKEAASALNRTEDVPVHALTITPEMRASIEGGQPTFALRPHGLPDVGQAKLPGELDQQAKDEQVRAAKESARIAGMTKFGPFREALNRFVGANQLTSLRVEREVKRIMDEVPDASRRVAITNYLQANGDLGVLKQRAADSKPAYRRGYEDAMKLTPQEKSVAASVSQFYKDMLVALQKHEVVDAGVENYVNQMWKQEVLGGDLKSPNANSRLMTDLRNAKERVFGSYFEGEQAGKVPVTKDIAHLMAIYATEAGKVVASRRFLKDLTTKKAADGRALAAVQGQIQDGENVGVETGDKSEGPTFIKANAHPEGYKTIDNPAFQGWKFLGKKNGEDVMMKGQMALHPDIFRHVQNVFGESAIDRMLRPNESNGPLLSLAKVVGRGALKLQSFAKGTTLGFLSPFHQVQEGTHAIGHHVNPFWGSPDHLLDPDNPLTRHAVDHGLMIAGDGQAMQMFKDSIDSNLVHAIPGLLGKIPKAGETLQKAGESSMSPVTWSKDYAHYLFHSFIPRLKMKTFLSIESNNLDRYAKEIAAGKVTKSDVAYLSAKQTNNAYGHLNWQDIGVDPTLLHFARITLLAPDFLAARAAFTGEAAKGAAGKKSGREQILALMTLAATQYITARILNKFSDDDYHLTDHPFSVVHDGREYTMRSVPEDIYKLLKQPEQFAKGRISPSVNMLQEALFQRNFRGEKVDYKDEVKDMVSMFIPITLRANSVYRQYLETGGKSTVNWWEQLAGASGIHISRNSPIAETYKMAADFKKELSDEDKTKYGVVEDKGVYPVSKYQQLRYALEDGDMAKALKEYEKLKDEGAKKLSEGFKESVFHPFTGSKHLDAVFAKSLPEEKQGMLDLAKHSRERIWESFKRVQKGEVGADEGGE